MSKFKAKPTDGYASKAESYRAKELLLANKLDLISNYEEQIRFRVEPEGCDKIEYIADFMYLDKAGLQTGSKGQVIVEDTKGKVTPVFALKAKLFMHKYPDLPLYVSRAIYRKSKLTHKTDITAFEVLRWPVKKRSKHATSGTRVQSKARKGHGSEAPATVESQESKSIRIC